MSPIEILIALVIGIVIFTVGLWVVRALAAPVAEPDPDAVVPVEGGYRCSICGTRVTMTHAPGADAKPPRHCREEMDREW